MSKKSRLNIDAIETKKDKCQQYWEIEKMEQESKENIKDLSRPSGHIYLYKVSVPFCFLEVTYEKSWHTYGQ